MSSSLSPFLQRIVRHFSSSSKMSLGDASSAGAVSIPEGAEKCTVAAGCFWGVEKLFRQHFAGKGLYDAKVGYVGGSKANPGYREVCSGRTGHAEALQIHYDPSALNYATLIEFFFKMHDPTTLNRQGMDAGSQYRSAIFPHSPEQKSIAEEIKQKVQDQWYKGKEVVTKIEDNSEWWDAETYHQRYLDANPGGYECPAQNFPPLS